MKPRPSILCVGEDTELLKTRVALLCGTGAEVEWSATCDALFAMDRKHFDLVVLCHSTGASESQQIYEAAHRGSATSRVLRLTPLWDRGLSDANGAKDGFDAVTVTEPSALMRTATALLRERERRGADVRCMR